MAFMSTASDFYSYIKLYLAVNNTSIFLFFFWGGGGGGPRKGGGDGWRFWMIIHIIISVLKQKEIISNECLKRIFINCPGDEFEYFIHETQPFTMVKKKEGDSKAGIPQADESRRREAYNGLLLEL